MPENSPLRNGIDSDQAKAEWLSHLNELVSQVRSWSEEFDWTTRQVEKQLDDSVIGKHMVPCLVLQQNAVRILLEPIARSAPNAEGVVDLYLMPGWDDIASLYLVDGQWQLHYMYPGEATVPSIRDAEPQPLSKETLNAVLSEMKQNASPVV